VEVGDGAEAPRHVLLTGATGFLLAPSRRFASSLPILEQWRHPIDMAKRRVDCTAFRAQVRALRPMGCADIPRLDDAYLDRCLDELVALGFIAPPPAPSR
jgi:hypothetical protein